MVKELQKEQMDKRYSKLWLVVVGFVLLAIVAVAILFICHLAPTADGYDYHKEAEQGVPIEVDFKVLMTTSEEYERLYTLCNEYIQSTEQTANYSMTANSIVDVSEDTYIDSDSTSPDAEAALVAEFLEYDRVYFENLLMLRYVNENGEIRVVASRLNGWNLSGTEVLDQEAIQPEYFNRTDLQNWNILSNMKEEMESSSVVSEQTFISCVGRCMAEMLTNKVNSETFFSHFTSSGETALVRIVQVLGIGSESIVEMQLGAAGKSDLNLDTMDRLYIRYKITDGAEVSYLNILLKLDQNFIIFDVDII